MTVAAPAPSPIQPHATTARLEVAWTVSAAALRDGAGYGSAVLHLACEWSRSGTQCTMVRACVLRGAEQRELRLPQPVLLEVIGRGRWVHLRANSNGGFFLHASFESGRLAYCTSDLPRIAGLAGGTYDAPTGLLELYESRH